MRYKYKDVEMEYEVFGEGKPLLMIHGYGVDKTCMKSSVEPLSNQLEGFIRYYIDLPHMGKSNWPSSVNSSDDFLDVIEHFIGELIPDIVGVMGYSYGGYLVSGLQQRYPDLPGFLLCPVTEPISDKRNVPKSKVVFVDEYIKNLKEIKYGYNNNVIQTKEKYERFLKDYGDALKVANGDKLADIFYKSYQFSFPLEKKVYGKTSALFGRLDDIVGYKDILKIEHLYDFLDVTVLDHAGHTLPIEQTEKFEEVLLRWIEEL